jgi:4-aminobutyrate aminotransferase-like enzyme
MGLYLITGLLSTRKTLEPAAEEANYVMNHMREHGILLGTDGPYHNVVKIRPPIPFAEGNAEYLVEVMRKVLEELEE